MLQYGWNAICNAAAVVMSVVGTEDADDELQCITDCTPSLLVPGICVHSAYIL